MKDSIILEGKNYISAKRAARLMNYAQDYVGQLCRSGKLDCRMIGRSWFVTEESLLAYREATIDGKDVIVEIPSTVATPVSSDNISSLVPSPFSVVEKPLLKYESVEGPSLPTLQKKVPQSFRIPSPVKMSYSGLSASGALSAPRPLSDAPATLIATLITVAFIAVAGFVFSLSTSMNRGPHTAYTTPSFITTFTSGLKHVVSLLTQGVNFAIYNETPITPQTASVAPQAPRQVVTTEDLANVFNGITVSPSSGSLEIDAMKKDQIRSSFSDEVEVRADKSGTAGVITPVFKKTKGDSFVYVLVPVKEKNKTP